MEIRFSFRLGRGYAAFFVASGLWNKSGMLFSATAGAVAVGAGLVATEATGGSIAIERTGLGNTEATGSVTTEITGLVASGATG